MVVRSNLAADACSLERVVRHRATEGKTPRQPKACPGTKQPAKKIATQKAQVGRPLRMEKMLRALGQDRTQNESANGTKNGNQRKRDQRPVGKSEVEDKRAKQPSYEDEQ